MLPYPSTRSLGERAVLGGGATMRQRFAIMRGNSAPLLNRKMSHELPQIIEANASPPPARGGKALTRSVWETHWWARSACASMANGGGGGLFGGVIF
jgi:hypothetical protein